MAHLEAELGNLMRFAENEYIQSLSIIICRKLTETSADTLILEILGVVETEVNLSAQEKSMFTNKFDKLDHDPSKQLENICYVVSLVYSIEAPWFFVILINGENKRYENSHVLNWDLNDKMLNFNAISKSKISFSLRSIESGTLDTLSSIMLFKGVAILEGG